MTKDYKIDLKDRKILYQLDINSRQSSQKIAKKVGLSKEVVNYRIKKLELLGFIKGYYTIIDFSRMGYFSVRAYLKIADCPLEKQKEMVRFLALHKSTFYVAEIDGPFEINIGVLVKDIYGFERFWQDFKLKFKRFIGAERISIFTGAYHFHRAYLLDKKNDDIKPEIFGSNRPERFDDKDILILKMLAKNARTHITDLSKKLLIPQRTIAFRIKQLEKKGIIQGYRFVFDFERYGYQYYKVDLALSSILRLNNLISYCQMHPNILYIDKTIAGSDFEFDLEVKDKEQFLCILNSLREKFPEIRSWSYFELRKYHKLLYFPQD